VGAGGGTQHGAGAMSHAEMIPEPRLPIKQNGGRGGRLVDFEARRRSK